MQKLLYISYVNYESDTDLGVVKKIEGQKKAFRKAGYEIDHLHMRGSGIYLNEEYAGTLKGKFDYWIRLPLLLRRRFGKSAGSYELVYVRKDLIYLPLYSLLFRRLKKVSSCLLLEIPTYPYIKELGSAFKDKVLLFCDRLTISLIRKTIFRIVTTQEYDRIWGIKTIRIRNGYDFSVRKQISRQDVNPALSRDRVGAPHEPSWPRQRGLTRRPGNTIRLITVATFNYWHGLDRLLQGMHRYYREGKQGKTRIMLHVVGDGKELGGYKQLAAELELQDVFFYGAKYGDELDEIYAQSDIGVGALALYRRGSSFQSLLKNAEYCYYGLPFITGNPDKDLAGKPFVLEFPNDDSPVDAGRIVDWYMQLKTGPEEIRRTGAALYSWDRQIDIIIKESRTKNQESRGARFRAPLR